MNLLSCERHWIFDDFSFEKFSTCNQDCKCDFVQYAPICGENNVTYVSSCHAGCTDEFTDKNGTKTFSNCICVNSPSENETSHFTGGSATQNACPLDCMPKFIVFFVFLCINKFIGGTEGTANFLLGVRWVFPLKIITTNQDNVDVPADASTKLTKLYRWEWLLQY